MDLVDFIVISDVQHDILSFGQQYSKADNIWRYMHCNRHHDFETIIIGQNPCKYEIVPFFGSSFSQVENSKDSLQLLYLQIFF